MRPTLPSPLLVRFLSALLLALVGLSGAAAHAATRVLFEIDMRPEIQAGRFDPTKDRLGIRGGAAPLSWDQPVMARPLKGEDGEPTGLYAAEVLFQQTPVGAAVAYKFRVERNNQAPGDGWETGQNRSLEIMTTELRVARVFNAPATPITLRRAGHIEQLGVIESRFVASRTVQVWLPPTYENEPNRRYPVLYLHDGQNVFDAAAAGAEWAADEAAQDLTVAGQIQPLIIVAVSNTGHRTDEYTPTRMKLDGEMQGGQVAQYARFLIEELKPRIDARFRTKTDAMHTAVGGSSFGGLASLWLAMHRSDVFGAALVVSPSLWWDDQFPIRDVARTPLPMSQDRPRLWLDMGTNEGPQSIRQLRQLRAQLFARGWQRTTLNYVEVPNGGHDEASWGARFGDMLRFLDRQVWSDAGRKEPAVGQDPFPAVPQREIYTPRQGQ